MRHEMRIAILGVLVVAGCSGGAGTWIEQDVPGEPDELTGMITPYALWAFAEDDVWLGGSSIWHYDGTSWTERAPSTPTTVTRFWGFGPDDLWAIGDSTALRWDGAVWRDESPTRDEASGFNALTVIWGQSSSDLWIANGDNSRVFHYDGERWKLTVLRFVAAKAIWGSSSADIWLTGVAGLYRYDGASWTEFDEGDDSPRGADALWGSSATDVWAADGANFIHWDGSAWTHHDQDLRHPYHALWGAGADDVHAVGSMGAYAHYDGSAWTEQQQGGRNLNVIHGSSPDNIWAAGVDFGSRSAYVVRLSR